MKRNNTGNLMCLTQTTINYTKLTISKTHKVFLSTLLVMTLPLIANAEQSISSAQNNSEQNNIAKTIRVATFNVSMDATNYLERGQTGNGTELVNALKNGQQQIKNIAEIIQRTRPNIILLNEFDYIKDPSQGIDKFIKNYLNKSQQGAKSIHYPYHYYSTVNTGVKFPLAKQKADNKNETNTLPGNIPDTYAFGHFPGHFGMVLLSQYPIDTDNIRTFQNFLWHDMPNALQPKDPETGETWYSDEAWQTLRLSSKSHWDIPISVNNKKFHILASHPTPPVFDGPENRNGTRNHDEIRFWNDYITPNQAAYIYDDNNNKGGLVANAPFIILGDQNASPDEGDALNSGIAELLSNPLTNNSNTPSSQGGKANSNGEFAQYHTAGWKMRADYVIPSTTGFTIKDSGVFWPMPNDPLFRLIEKRSSSSDHRLVWLDLEVK